MTSIGVIWILKPWILKPVYCLGDTPVYNGFQ